MNNDWLVSVRGNVNRFRSAKFQSEREALAYFKTIRRSLDSSKFIITREFIVDREDPVNKVTLTKLPENLGITAETAKQAAIASTFHNQPYIELLHKAMNILEQHGYSIVKKQNEYLVNIYYKVVYLGLAEVFITSSDTYFEEDSIIIEKESPEELAGKMMEIINKRDKLD